MCTTLKIINRFFIVVRTPVHLFGQRTVLRNAFWEVLLPNVPLYLTSQIQMQIHENHKYKYNYKSCAWLTSNFKKCFLEKFYFRMCNCARPAEWQRNWQHATKTCFMSIHLCQGWFNCGRILFAITKYRLDYDQYVLICFIVKWARYCHS